MRLAGLDARLAAGHVLDATHGKELAQLGGVQDMVGADRQFSTGLTVDHGYRAHAITLHHSCERPVVAQDAQQAA